MTSKTLHKLYISNKEKTLSGRYITVDMIAPLVKKMTSNFKVNKIGDSVEGVPIHSIKLGSGPKKVLLWSQMHGNESTTTKALFDLLNCFSENNASVQNILESCTLMIMPILNPDGAHYYTRVNANDIDLNRDAQDLSQPESKILRELFDEFKPAYCFNLHGQRTIFGAGNSGRSATLSFLAPAMDADKSLPMHRKQAMCIIASLHSRLSVELDGGIGLYDDGFNLNCVGDTFQNLGASTVLFEAGHFPDDYNREETRKYIFYALYHALTHISRGVAVDDYQQYFDIPKNEVCFYDVLIKHARLFQSDEKTVDIAIQFREDLVGNKVVFVPEIIKIEDLDGYFGHKTIDAKNSVVCDSKNKTLKVGSEIDFVILNNRKILIKS
ncbi:M14 family zinc carboxypeptidase [Winogradskyella sp. A3E31]|uniref:M14 family zinc carboxypeptidase n=1 Tax=Winogradskyella sp. A3E31 TaxID=3349637 RepID=UPI00398A8D3D